MQSFQSNCPPDWSEEVFGKKKNKATRIEEEGMHRKHAFEMATHLPRVQGETLIHCFKLSIPWAGMHMITSENKKLKANAGYIV